MSNQCDELNLFPIKQIEEKADWKNEWVGMPAFNQDKKEEFSKVIIRFETKEDLESFSKLIGQKLTPKTKSIWFPFKSHWGNGPKLFWQDES
jgi:hypothetical protein